MLSRIRQAVNNANIVRFRFWVQLFSFALLVYGGYLAINIGNHLPTFACVFEDGRGGSCYLMGFQHQMVTPWPSYLSGRGIGVLVAFVTFVGVFLLLNKAWCGYVCPLGTIQDWLTSLRSKLAIRDSGYGATTFSRLKKVKYILLLLMILLPMAIGNSFGGLPKLNHDFGVPFCMICPGRTILPLFIGDVSQLAVDFSSITKMVFTALGLIITGIFLVGAFVKKRFLCLFCPMSAFHYLFHKAGLLRLTKIGSKCTRCGNCYRACDMGIREIADDITSHNIVKDDCMMCLKCVAVCPEQDCLQVTYLGLPIYKATEEGFFKRTRENRGN